jgi:glycosyltransferase involved in cell wall biosynthesis
MPLTVLQLLPALDQGGVERGTLEVAKALVENGHRAIVISSGGRMVAELKQLGGEHITLPVGEKSIISLRLVPQLRRILLEHNIDIIHARSRVPAWLSYLAWRKFRAQQRPRFVTTVHGLYSVNPYSAVMTKGERIIAVSNTVREYILQNYPKTPSDRITVIHRGIDPSAYPYGYLPSENWRIKFYTEYPQLRNKRLLILPGRITRLKGHEDFINLLKNLHGHDPSLHGVIVGNVTPDKQAYWQSLQTLVTKIGLQEAITFTGGRSDLREIMAISSVVFSLSVKPESFGRTTLEVPSTRKV